MARGGKRPGAGRPSLDLQSKPLRVPLPDDAWEYIDSEIQSGNYKSYAEFFRKAAVDRLQTHHEYKEV